METEKIEIDKQLLKIRKRLKVKAVIVSLI